MSEHEVRFEGGGTQFRGPGSQCPVRPVPAKTDYTISGLGDDASHWFLVGMATDPRVLECRANVVFHLGTHLLISGLIEQQAGAALMSPATSQAGGVAGNRCKKEAVFCGNGLFRAGGRCCFQKLSTGLFLGFPQGISHPIANSGDAKITWRGPRRIVLSVAPQLPIQIGKSSKPPLPPSCSARVRRDCGQYREVAGTIA
jgi:hypothetical protein